MRSCGDCTKCCEGYLNGEVRGHKFFPGTPCFFVQIGKGCIEYKDRPQNPCKSYQCEWVRSKDIPAWMKPNAVNAIVDIQKTKNGIQYLRVTEAGSDLDSRVLTWILKYALNNGINLMWSVGGGKHWLGTPEFSKEMETL